MLQVYLQSTYICVFVCHPQFSEQLRNPALVLLLMAPREQTTVKNVVFWVCAIDAADKALLPATFKALSLQMHVGPQRLGALMFAQSIAFAAALPFWGSMIRFSSYRDLLTSGCLLWGGATLALCFTVDYYAHFFYRIVIGFALAVVNPIGQAILCDVVPEAERGWAFGVLGAVSTCLSMAVSFGTTAIAATYVFGFHGWRVAYAAVAAMSFVMAMVVHTCVPLNVSGPAVQSIKESKSWLREQQDILASVMSKPSFFIMVAQGVTGGIPWNAMAFLTLFFQSSGYSDATAGAIIFWGGFGGILGSPLGGFLGDFFARLLPDAGRCAVAQMSVLLGTLCFLVFMYIPYSTNSFVLVTCAMFSFNLVSCWTQPAALRPICGNLMTDSKKRAQILSWWLAFEGLISAIFGAPLVGLLSGSFGYELSEAHNGPHQEEHGNMIAIRSALVSVSLVCWTLCFVAWVPMYWTYPRDRDRLMSKTDTQCYDSTQRTG